MAVLDNEQFGRLRCEPEQLVSALPEVRHVHRSEAVAWPLQEERGGDATALKAEVAGEVVGTLAPPILPGRVAEDLAEARLEGVLRDTLHRAPVHVHVYGLDLLELVDVIDVVFEEIVGEPRRVERDIRDWFEPRRSDDERPEDQPLRSHLAQDGDDRSRRRALSEHGGEWLARTRSVVNSSTTLRPHSTTGNQLTDIRSGRSQISGAAAKVSVEHTTSPPSGLASTATAESGRRFAARQAARQTIGELWAGRSA